jgi:hypothetical protein
LAALATRGRRLLAPHPPLAGFPLRAALASLAF